MNLFRFFLVSAFLAAVIPTALFADTIEELQLKIAERNQAIESLEREIIAYQNDIEAIGKEAKTLQGTIKGIDLEQKKLGAEIKVTENKIGKVTLLLQELGQEIGEKERRIVGNEAAMAKAIRSIHEAEQNTLLETLLSERTLSTFLEEVETLQRFEESMRNDLLTTRELKTGLEEHKTLTEKNRRQLLNLKGELSDRTQLLAQSKKTKNSILAATKNKEAEYRKLLAQKVALRNAFEQELLEFESQLRFEIDPSNLPRTGTGVLRWPLDAVKITQHFGDTEFAATGAYRGGGHNGIDFRASNGTPIKAALAGTVDGTGNTDTVCPGASYGRWVLIRHDNGLSTLYAHLSLVRVGVNQRVDTGEVIGYAGDTGYATGPHLHFTVYATQGVRIIQRKSSVCRGTYTMPVADLKAYLNPLSYL